MPKSNTLIIGAHLDDIEIGLGGYLSTLNKKQTKRIHTYTACSGLGNYDHKRQQTFIKNMKKLGITQNYTHDFKDTTLTNKDIQIIKTSLSGIIETKNIKTIFVVNGDNHNDHKLIFEAVKICARQSKTKVNKLYAYQVYTNLNLKDFNCSLPFYTKEKYNMINNYNQDNNIVAIENQDLVFGANIQELYAEKVKVIFDTI